MYQWDGSVLAHFCLVCIAHAGVDSCEEWRGGDSGGIVVSCGKATEQWHKRILRIQEELGHFGERLDSLHVTLLEAQRASAGVDPQLHLWSPSTRVAGVNLVPHKSLFGGAESFQRQKKNICMLLPTNMGNHVA